MNGVLSFLGKMSHQQHVSPSFDASSDHDPLVLACGTDDNYALSLAVTLYSALANIRKRSTVVIYVIDDGISPNNKYRLTELCKLDGISVQIEWVTPSQPLRDLRTDRWITTASYLRLLLPEIVPPQFEKVIYLDSDLVVLRDLSYLWEHDLNEQSVLAVQDFGTPYVSSSWGIAKYRELGLDPATPYFNAGVLVINLKKWRSDCVGEKAFRYLRDYRPHVRLHDQEALNVVLAGVWGALDPRWNQMPLIYSYSHWPPSAFKEETECIHGELVEHPYIIHFAGPTKPWRPNCTHPGRVHFQRYLKESGWSASSQAGRWHVAGSRQSLPVAKTEPDNPIAETRHRCFDLSVRTLGGSMALVRSKDSGGAILPLSTVQLLLSCDTFDTLSNHAIAIVRKRKQNQLRQAAYNPRTLRERLFSPLLRNLKLLEGGAEIPLRSGEIASVQGQLSELVLKGRLFSEKDLFTEIAEIGALRSADAHVRISSIGIPTRNRPVCLQRAVESYASNVERSGREVKLIIVDDWEHSDGEQFQQILYMRNGGHGVDLRYVSRSDRVRFADELAHCAHVPVEAARFALLGDPRCTSTYGAPRNTLLLLTTGELCLQVDDDTICRVAAAPDGITGLSLTSRSDPNEHWYFRDSNAGLSLLQFIDEDYLSIHEQLLGRSIADCLAAELDQGKDLDYGSISPRFLKNMSLPGAGIVVSHIGSVGDAGSDINAGRLFLEGSSFERLTRSVDEYRSSLSTRQSLQAPTRRSISDQRACKAMNIGLDNRTLLPPFMPVQRNEDGVFGAVLNACAPHAFSGYLPYVVEHSPSESRSSYNASGDALLQPPRANDLLQWLILAFESKPYLTTVEDRMQALGTHLMGLGSLKPDDFDELTYTICCSVATEHIHKAEHALDKNSSAPAYWRDDVGKYVSAWYHVIGSKDFFVPADLVGVVGERRTVFQELVYQYGQLLTVWPAIVQAAQDLRERGYDPTLRRRSGVVV